MTFGAAVILRYLEQRSRVSCLPMLVALNALMIFVLINNSSVIAQSYALTLKKISRAASRR